jgi:hypothetical protein
MSMSMSPSAGSTRARRRERLCIAHGTLGDMRLIGDASGAVHMRRHAGAACRQAVIGTPLPKTP